MKVLVISFSFEQEPEALQVLEDAGLRDKLAEEAKRRSENYTWQKRAGIFLNGRKHA